MLFEANRLQRAKEEVSKALALFVKARRALLVDIDTGCTESFETSSNAEMRRAEALTRTVLAVAMTIGEHLYESIESEFKSTLVSKTSYFFEAERHFDFAMALDPLNADVFCARAGFRIACNNIPGALRDLKEALVQEPSLFEAHIVRATIFIEKMCDLESATLAAKEAHAPRLRHVIFHFLKVKSNHKKDETPTLNR